MTELTSVPMRKEDHIDLEQLRIDHMHKTRKFINQQDFLHIVIQKAKR